MAEEKDKKKPREKKELDFDYCPIHRIRFPKGSTCPKCDEERRKKK